MSFHDEPHQNAIGASAHTGTFRDGSASATGWESCVEPDIEIVTDDDLRRCDEVYKAMLRAESDLKQGKNATGNEDASSCTTLAWVPRVLVSFRRYVMVRTFLARLKERAGLPVGVCLAHKLAKARAARALYEIFLEN